MAKTYNLYFGKGENQVKYYTPSTPKAELQNLIDDPDQWEKYLKDQEDALKLVEGERNALEKERDALKTERDDYKKQVSDFGKFLKDVVGYNTIDELKNALGGEKLPDILTNTETSIKTLKASEDKLKKDVGTLMNQAAGMVSRVDLKNVDEARKKAVKSLDNLQNLYDPLKLATDQLNTKWSTANLNELDAKIKQLDTNDKARLKIINKYSVANLAKLDEYIIKVWDEKEAEKQKIKDAKDPFNRIVDRINERKTVIVGDLLKINIRLDLNRVKGALGYADINADIDSGEE